MNISETRNNINIALTILLSIFLLLTSGFVYFAYNTNTALIIKDFEDISNYFADSIEIFIIEENVGYRFNADYKELGLKSVMVTRNRSRFDYDILYTTDSYHYNDFIHTKTPILEKGNFYHTNMIELYQQEQIFVYIMKDGSRYFSLAINLVLYMVSLLILITVTYVGIVKFFHFQIYEPLKYLKTKLNLFGELGMSNNMSKYKGKYIPELEAFENNLNKSITEVNSLIYDLTSKIDRSSILLMSITNELPKHITFDIDEAIADNTGHLFHMAHTDYYLSNKNIENKYVGVIRFDKNEDINYIHGNLNSHPIFVKSALKKSVGNLKLRDLHPRIYSIVRNNMELLTETHELKWSTLDFYSKNELTCLEINIIKNEGSHYSCYIKDISFEKVQRGILKNEVMMYKKILDKIPMAVMVRNPYHPDVYANELTSKLFGVEKQNMSDFRLKELLEDHPKILGQILELDDVLEEKNHINFETEFNNKWYRVGVNKIYIGAQKQPRYVIYAEDIDDTIASGDIISKILKYTDSSIFITDKNGTIKEVYANNEKLSKDKELFLGENIIDHVTDIDQSALFKAAFDDAYEKNIDRMSFYSKKIKGRKVNTLATIKKIDEDRVVIILKETNKV